MATVTAEALNALGISKILVDFAPYMNDVMHLYRVLPDGREEEVIGSPVVLSGGKAILYDTLAPLDVPLHYRAELREAQILRDLFASRTLVNTWGSPEYVAGGGSWTNLGGVAADYDVTNGTGTHTHPNANIFHRSVAAASARNVRMEATVSIPTNPTVASLRAALAPRYVNATNYYHFIVQFSSVGNAVSAIITKTVAGVTTTLVNSVIPNMQHAPNMPFRIVAEVVDSNLRMWVWNGTEGSTNGPPTHSITDSSVTGAGAVSVASWRFTGNTNTNVVISFDNIVAKTLDVQSVSTLTPVTIEADPHGWLRDPLLPGRSLRLDDCATHTFDCLNATGFVFFRSFAPEAYASASGQFSVIDEARPITIAQTRKDLTSELRFASTALDDIRDIRTLFSSGRVLALSLPERYGWGLDNYGTDTFQAGDVSASRINTRQMSKPHRDWVVPLAVADVDASATRGGLGTNRIPVPGATYAEMTATGMTYGQLEATGNTYLEWAQGEYA